jgi:hypothetical protein
MLAFPPPIDSLYPVNLGVIITLLLWKEAPPSPFYESILSSSNLLCLGVEYTEVSDMSRFDRSVSSLKASLSCCALTLASKREQLLLRRLSLIFPEGWISGKSLGELKSWPRPARRWAVEEG